jgi:putative ABC transport system ATP-binding protein
VPSMIELLDLEHRYDQSLVLAVPGWRVAGGERWLVHGPSGSGKSTLLHIVAGLLLPSRGQVVVAGRALGEMAAAERDRFRGQRIGVVFQRFHLLGWLSALDNVRLAGQLAGMSGTPDRARGLLERLGLGDHLQARPAALSQGQRQRVAIARAVVNEPALVLADEPTASLDDEGADTVLALLEEQAASCGATLVVASHDRRLRSRFAHHLPVGGAP